MRLGHLRTDVQPESEVSTLVAQVRAPVGIENPVQICQGNHSTMIRYRQHGFVVLNERTNQDRG